MAGALGGFMAGSIFAKLVLDKTGWNASVQSVDKDKKTLSDVAGKIGKSFEDVGKKLTVVGGAIVASFGAMITKTADYGDMIHDMSERTGIATEILSGYKLAADQSGTSIEGFATGMKGLSRVMAEAASGGKEAQAAFDDIGVKATTTSGKLRPLDQVMLDVADRFASMENGAAKNALAMKLFGKAGMDLIPMLNMGSEGLKKAYEEAKRLGLVLSKEDAAACDEFNDRLIELKGGLSGARNALAMQLMPMLTDFIIKVKEVIIHVSKWMKAHPELVTWIGGTTLKLGALFAVLGPLLIIISKLITASIAMGAGFASALGPITLFTAAAIATHKIISDLIKAKEKLAEKDFIAFEANERLAQKLREVTDAAGLTRAEFHQLALKYDENYAAMAMAIKKGKETVELQEALTEVGKKHGAAIDEEIKKIADKEKSLIDLTGGIITAKDAEKEYVTFLESAGIKMYDPARISDFLGWQKRLADEFKSGKIDAEDYAKGMAKLNAELWDFGGFVKTAIPPARDLSNAIKLAPGSFDSLTYAIKTDTEILDEWAVELGLTRPRVAAAVYEINRLQLALMGIYMPEIDWGLPVDGAVEATSEISGAFDGLMNDIARGFGDTFQNFISGPISFKSLGEAAKALWGNIKDAFFTMCGQMATKWATDLIGSIIDGAKKAAKTATDTLGAVASSIGSGAAGIASSFLSAAGSIGSIVSGVASIIGLLKGPEKATDVTYWLKIMSENLQIIRNYSQSLAEMIHEVMVATWDFMGLVGHIYDLMANDIDHVGDRIVDAVGKVKDAIENLELGGAQHGAIITKTGLIKVHGTPSRPEIIAPLPNLGRFISGQRTDNQAVTREINIKNEVHIDGVLITDREYTRTRLMPEIIEALSSNLLKSKIQQALGV